MEGTLWLFDRETSAALRTRIETSFRLALASDLCRSFESNMRMITSIRTMDAETYRTDPIP